MSDDVKTLKDDVAFLRELASTSGQSTGRHGAILVAAGTIFGAVNICYWALASGLMHLAGVWEHAPWITGLLLFIAALIAVQRRFPKCPGAASRAFGAASASVGIGISAAVIALIGASLQFEEPLLVPRIFPIILLTLYGTSWCVAYAVRRRAWFGLVAVGCFAGAIACGFLVTRPEEWLVLAAGLILLVAVPGYVILRQSRD